jgi:hypothetical protein
MKFTRTLIAITMLALAASIPVQAQQKAAPAAPRGGEMTAPQLVDEGVVKAAKPAPSTVDRKALQKEAAAATKAGTTDSGECSAEQKADVGACKKAPVTSNVARAEVKPQAAAAAKIGAPGAGEAPAPMPVRK